MHKIALITGGSRGLGRDISLSLAKKGIDVILTYHTKQEEADEVVSEIISLGQKASKLHFDFGDMARHETFIQQLLAVLKDNWDTGKIDFLVNNAGIGATIPFMQATEDAFDNFMNITFKGVYFLSQKLIPYMNDNGSIVNISSGTTRFVNPGYSLYASMKGAVEVLTRYMAKELGKGESGPMW